MKRPIILAVAAFILIIMIANIDIARCTVERERHDSPGVFDAYDQNGYYTAYRNVSVGENVTSIFVHDPLSNAPDAIILRVDFCDSGIQVN